MAGATSDLPSNGGLSPDVGVNYQYFVGQDGFSRPMFEREGALLHWAEGMFVLTGTDGRERLLGMVSVRKSWRWRPPAGWSSSTTTAACSGRSATCR
jgi:hypothetical protein